LKSSLTQDEGKVNKSIPRHTHKTSHVDHAISNT